MKSLKQNETGAALITAILVLMLASGLMAGMFAALMANQRTQATDRDQSVAYAAAHAGLEKLTSRLGSLFGTDFSPEASELTDIESTPPAIPGFTYVSPDGTSGYDISFTPDGSGNPQALSNADITTGPFEGFKGLITPYVLTVTARSTTGNSEVRLRRELQTVAVPVFQFGIFGEKSLGFHAGPSFDFGGRVHTNQSLFLAQGDSNTLTFRDKITAVTQVVRNRLMNGSLTSDTDHEGTVSIPTIIGGASGTYRNLAATESSGTINEPCITTTATTNSNCWNKWKNLSTNIYKTTIRTAATGAKELNLPLTTDNVGPIELIKRPAVNEDATKPSLYGQRYYAQASLRILLSDRTTDITTLPTITAGAPLQLDGPGPAGYVVAAGRPPIPQSPGPEPHDGGVSLTQVSAVSGGTLTVQNKPTAAGAWTTAVPVWLGKPAGVLAKVGAFNLPCTGISTTQLTGCDTSVVANRHPAYSTGQVISVMTGNGAYVNVTTTANASLNSATISISSATTTGVPLATQYKAMHPRGFFVAEDPIFCTGFNATQLTGCTSPGTINTGPLYTGATTPAGTPLLSGYIKIEKQDNAGNWTDVTLELLNLGFAGPVQQGDACGNGTTTFPDPTPNAVIRLMRFRDNGYTSNLCNGANGVLDYTNSLDPQDYWPNMLFDAREGSTRAEGTGDGMNMGGLFSYVAIDASNLRRWFAGNIGTTGTQALNNNGYIIYFSDRRGDHDETNGDVETGEYGHEDSINPAAATWAKNNVLDEGEDFNENGTLQTYGESPHPLVVPAGAIANFDANQRPWTEVAKNYSGRGRLARPVLFRRALKIINGGIDGSGNNLLPASGVNFVAENPIYIQGNFNATAASVTAEPNIPAAVIGDSITLLSNTFLDSVTFQFPNDMASRPATTTGYRFAMVTGKAVPFPKPSGWGDIEMGSDGGVHNFMKMLENWSGQSLRYRGSMVSLYFSRQAIGIYRTTGSNIYGAPSRGYNFDTDFLSPPLLPPGTPMFRDINTLKFRQILRPNQ